MTALMRFACATFCSLLLSCETVGSDCEAARSYMTSQIDALCKDDPAYKNSQFCAVCVTELRMYSTGGPPDCRCKALTFDQEFCAFTKDVGEVRSAIDYADRT